MKPDLVLFEDKDLARRSWETLMMPIEVKAKHTYLKVGMKRLTKYARAVLAHQIHRRHLYGMVICKWQVTFVRFDRSGIVHSPPIDMLRNAEEFQQAFAGLMMMDRRAFEYDTAFTTEYTPGGRIEYYVDLPATAVSSDVEPDSEPLDSPDGDPAQSLAPQPFPTRRFKVKERLCHRKDIRGCATIVLRLRAVKKRTTQPEPGRAAMGRVLSQISTYKWEEVPGRPDYVLKLTWRNSDNRNEGEILRTLEGEYGVAQCLWYSDVVEWGAGCHGAYAASCDECHDATPAHKVRRVKNLGDLDIRITKEKAGKEPRHAEVDTDGFLGELDTHRAARIYTWTLFSTAGKPLCTAESPRQFLEAVLDAILGYWQVFNRGIIHRDISDGNVLIVEPGWGCNMRTWKSEQGTLREGQSATGVLNDSLAESKRRAHETIVQLGRDPIGFLSDFDLAATCAEMGHDTSSHAATKRTRPSDTEAIADIQLPLKRYRRVRGASNLLSTSAADGVQIGWHLEGQIPSPTPETHKPIDFRTGTPPFMSIRVLKIEVGTPYEHHFVDDLESFFWLILRCVVAHRDANPGKTEGFKTLTPKALELLDKLDQSDSKSSTTLVDSKACLLMSCTDGMDGEPCTMEETLERCQNSWANNPAIVNVILNLVARFYTLHATRGLVAKCTPEAEFPKMIGIISEGLESL
ncbi:unnamed protein product [Rhizoctonia solani]|uniref:Fungal-type protein kinase domain-containing protein n=1 Tax=Rhizoctonia solani TaxID=456999 RepID=A0A8H3DV41_9AGAM|nr:unnamed protein product [Rhizoctonia solani]